MILDSGSMHKIATQSLADIITNYPSAIGVMEKYALNYCCDGKRTLYQACMDIGLNIEKVLEELVSIPKIISKKQMPFAKMDVDQLLSYIIIHHHYYIKESMPVIDAHLSHVKLTQGLGFPYMVKVHELFRLFMRDMILHMDREEKVLFPRIKEDEHLVKNGKSSESFSGYFQNLIKVAEVAHTEEGNVFYEIRRLTQNYKAPEGAGKIFKKVLKELKEFEEDLHKHVHLERNILFPKAIKFELRSHPVNHGIKF